MLCMYTACALCCDGHLDSREQLQVVSGYHKFGGHQLCKPKVHFGLVLMPLNMADQLCIMYTCSRYACTAAQS